MKKIVIIVISVVIGIAIGFVLFAFTPIGNRYKVMKDEGPGFYEYDTWTGGVRYCGPMVVDDYGSRRFRCKWND